MKVTRADWAGSVPWAGITGKPASLDSATGSAADLSELTARVAALENALAALTPSTVAIPSVTVWWAVGVLEPLQMAYEDLPAPTGANDSFAVGAPFSAGTGVFFDAYPLGDGVLRLVAANFSGSAVTLPMTNYTIFLLNG
jgi:hypothetical protein